MSCVIMRFVAGLPSCIAETLCMGRPRNISDVDIEHLRSLRSAGKSLTEMVVMTGFSRVTIQRYTKGLGRTNVRHDFSDETIAKMRALREGGATYREISQTLNVPIHAVAMRMSTVKMKEQVRRQSLNDLSPEKIERAKKMRAEGVAVPAIARALNSTEHFVKKHTDQDATEWKGRFQRASGKVVELGCRVCNWTIEVTAPNRTTTMGAMEYMDHWLAGTRVICGHCGTSLALLQLADYDEWYFVLGVSSIQD